MVAGGVSGHQIAAVVRLIVVAGGISDHQIAAVVRLIVVASWCK